MTHECFGCGASRDLRGGFCFDCASAGEARAARRTVVQHICVGFRNLRKRNGCAKYDFQWAWERLTKTGDYAPGGYFAAFGISTEPKP